MSTTLTGVTANWDTPLTVSGAEKPSSADMADVLRSHANRAQFLYEKRWRGAMRLTALDPGITQLGACVNEKVGVYMAVASGGAWRAISLATPGDSTVYASGTLTGTPTFTTDVSSATNGDVVIFCYGGSIYRFSNTFSLGTNAFADLTTVHDVLYSEYASQFIAVGLDSGSNGTVEVSATGASWSEKTGASSTNNPYSMIAADATGQYVLVAPLVGDDWAYSDDGGSTWTVYTVAVDSDATITTTDLCYDDANAQWLMTLVASSFSGDATRIWKTSDPTTASWTSTAAMPAYGLQGESVTAACGIIAIDDFWIAGVGSANYFNILRSDDGGTTWGSGWANPGNTYDESSAPLRFRRSGTYLFLTDAGVPGYITDAL